MHTHIAGGKVNTARVMRPEDVKSGIRRNPGFRAESGYTVPNSYGIGYRYARMGYTTAFEPANPPISAFHTHEELDAIPMIDKGTFVLSGNNWNVMEYTKKGDMEKLAAYMAWLLNRTKSYGIKVVNPGGIEAWAYGKNMRGLDDVVPYFEVTPADIINSLVKVNEELSLPHPVHLHCNNLGVPGNFETTLQSMKLVEGIENKDRPVLHVTHVQFNSYAGDSWKTFSSGAEEIARYVNKVDNITVDMGQPVFGSATTMTADAPAQFALHKLTKAKWSNMDVELETGAGILPFFYSPKNPVTAWKM
jgi:formylmethanofuran dehydrogenase subunit A